MRYEVPHLPGSLGERPGELPGGLHGPFGRGVRGDPEQVDEPGARVDDEEYVHPREVDQVHMEEVAGHKRCGVGAQERAPRVHGGALRGGRDPVRAHGLADRCGRYAMSQTTKPPWTRV
jgi:hypothetical protein